jgi:hypothetical protein
VQLKCEHLDIQLPVIAKWEHIETVWTWKTHTISPVVQAYGHPLQPYCTERNESELGCTVYELQWLQVRTTALCPSFGATAQIWALPFLHETLYFTSVY